MWMGVILGMRIHKGRGVDEVDTGSPHTSKERADQDIAPDKWIAPASGDEAIPGDQQVGPVLACVGIEGHVRDPDEGGGEK